MFKFLLNITTRSYVELDTLVDHIFSKKDFPYYLNVYIATDWFLFILWPHIKENLKAIQ